MISGHNLLGKLQSAYDEAKPAAVAYGAIADAWCNMWCRLVRCLAVFQMVG